MASPVTRKSVNSAESVGAGESVRSLGHYHHTLFVAAEGSDGVTVTLEASPDGDRWATLTEIASADLSEDDESGAFTGVSGVTGRYVEHLRARVVDHDGTATVDAYVMSGGNPGQGRKGTSRKGAVSDL